MKSWLIFTTAFMFAQVVIAEDSQEKFVDGIESEIRNVFKSQKKDNEVITLFIKHHHHYTRLISSNPEIEGVDLDHDISKKLNQHRTLKLEKIKVGKYMCEDVFIKTYNHGKYAIGKGFNCNTSND